MRSHVALTVLIKCLTYQFTFMCQMNLLKQHRQFHIVCCSKLMTIIYTQLIEIVLLPYTLYSLNCIYSNCCPRGLSLKKIAMFNSDLLCIFDDNVKGFDDSFIM